MRAILPTKAISLLANTANVKAFVEGVAMELAAAMKIVTEEVITKPSVATSAAACMKGMLRVCPQDLGVFRSI
jgi:hypothetical protein